MNRVLKLVDMYKQLYKCTFIKTFWPNQLSKNRENHYFHNLTHSEHYQTYTLSINWQSFADGAFQPNCFWFDNHMDIEQLSQMNIVLLHTL